MDRIQIERTLSYLGRDPSHGEAILDLLGFQCSLSTILDRSSTVSCFQISFVYVLSQCFCFQVPPPEEVTFSFKLFLPRFSFG